MAPPGAHSPEAIHFAGELRAAQVVTERIGLAAFIAHFDSTFKPGNFREHERRNTTNIRGVLWSVVAECDNSRCHSGCSIGAFEGAARMLQAAHAIPSHAFNQSIYRSCDGYDWQGPALPFCPNPNLTVVYTSM
jgi:hypothetical protein